MRPATATFPAEYGGSDGTIYGMAVVRASCAPWTRPLQRPSKRTLIVGNNVGLLLMINYGTEEQKPTGLTSPKAAEVSFGITEPEHGSDAPMDTHAVKDGDEWIINGEKTWNTGIHKADCDLIFAERVEPPATVTASPRSWCQPTRLALRFSNISGHSICRPRPSDSPMLGTSLGNIRRRGQRPAGRAALLQRKTGFAKQHQVLVPPNSASMNL